MRTPRVFLSTCLEVGQEVRLPEAEAHHLLQVLRRKVGDSVLLASKSGIFEGVLIGLEGESATADASFEVRVEVRRVADEASIPTVPWTVAVARVKGQGMDQAVRIASELGLERLVPLTTARTVVRGPAASKAERWKRIAQESAKQCGRAPPLEVAPGVSFQKLVAGAGGGGPAEARWIAVPGAPWPALGGARGPNGLGGRGPSPTGELAEALFLVGPEGGFTPEEVEMATAAGFRPLGFPTPTLRTPTAVLLLAALGLLLGPESR